MNQRENTRKYDKITARLRQGESTRVNLNN